MQGVHETYQRSRHHIQSSARKLCLVILKRGIGECAVDSAWQPQYAAGTACGGDGKKVAPTVQSRREDCNCAALLR